VESIPQAFLPVGPMAAALVEEQVAASVVGVAAVVQVVTSNWISELIGYGCLCTHNLSFVQNQETNSRIDAFCVVVTTLRGRAKLM